MLAMCKYIVHVISIYKWHFMCVVKGSKILIICGVMNECWTIPTVNVRYTKSQTTKLWWLTNMEYKYLKM